MKFDRNPENLQWLNMQPSLRASAGRAFGLAEASGALGFGPLGPGKPRGGTETHSAPFLNFISDLEGPPFRHVCGARHISLQTDSRDERVLDS